MKRELDDALVRDFPLLYAARHKAMTETLMCFGFECEDGWEPIIRDLSAKLEPLIAAYPEDQRAQFAAQQVKEKYGELCLYMYYETGEMNHFISEAKDKSRITCEACGAPGKLRVSDGWYRTTCEAH